ncbi:MAG: SMP-30/gluconolactonase/LRE family protein [Chloroflexota bacterium]|nr:SMP-30/gluconolactonase/LRE family protein [Chloroflexota bacterium]MDE2839405.1 SMP-30/gluconolactonase/LRE family protein [Chloroflexota bacterium]MDE2929619.1 SMP-30/gluconolactonase/LRE family protein [Chloroflexota bacterium]
MATKFDVRNPAFFDLVPRDAELERVAGGFQFTEGPVWRDGGLLFSDIPNSRTVRWQESPEGFSVSTYRTPSGNANGLTLDHQGRLISCEHSARRVSREETDGMFTTLADSYQGKKLNSPNDVVVSTDGTLYFTDPPYGVEDLGQEPDLDFRGVYMITPDGVLHLLVDDFDRPNGLAFASDERTLYVNDSRRRHIRAFVVRDDGTLHNYRVWTDMSSSDDGSPDGMKVDTAGNVFCTGPGGIWVMNPAGHVLGRIIGDEQPANVAWGEADWSTLFVTARTGLYRIRLNTTGIPVPR